MADERFLIRCRACGKGQVFASWFGCEISILYGEELKDFIYNHLLDCWGLPANEFSMSDKFDIASEHEWPVDNRPS